MLEDPGSREGVLRVEVTGNSTVPWVSLKPKLVEAIQSLIAGLSKESHETRYGEDIKNVTTSILQLCESRQDTIPLDLHQIEQKVVQQFAQNEVFFAEARRINAQAEAQELANKIKKLRLLLSTTKVVLLADPNEETLLIGRQIESFIEALRELQP